MKLGVKMRKFFVCAVFFAAISFVISCGGSSDTLYDEENDSSEQGVSDSDDENVTTSDSDENNAVDSDQELPEDQEITDDNETEGKDNNEKPCEDENPCEEMPNSTGECTIKNEDFICGCKENYTWNGYSCMANSHSAKCSGLPENAEWNSVSEIIQVWNGEKWIPSKEASYCENESENECCFKCEKNHHWVDSNCIPECSSKSATPCIDLNTDLIWSAKSENTMHWNDTFEYCANLKEGEFDDWKLPSIKVLNTLVRNCDSDSGCEGNTDGLYSEFGEISVLWSSNSIDSNNAQGINFLDGSTVTKGTDNSFYVRCVRGNLTTRTVKCKLDQENAEINRFTKIEQTWDWNDMWVPSNIAVFNTESKEGECRFKCDENYGWDGKHCINTCKDGETESFPCIDPATKLVWATPKLGNYRGSEAKTYCENLTENDFDDWYLPNISELRTLIINCSKTVTGGTCSVSSDCLYKNSTCYSYNSCVCTKNETVNGYYSKLGEGGIFWSSNYTTNDDTYSWCIDFQNGEIGYTDNDNSILESNKNTYHNVQCVKNIK